MLGIAEENSENWPHLVVHEAGRRWIEGVRSRMSRLPVRVRHSAVARDTLEIALQERRCIVLAELGRRPLDILDLLEQIYGLGRELTVIVEAHARCQSSLITAEDITPRIQGAWGGAFAAPASDQRVDLDAVLLEAERKLIEQAIKKARGNKSQAAELLSISRPRLYRRMQILGMDGAGGDEPATAEV